MYNFCDLVLFVSLFINKFEPPRITEFTELQMQLEEPPMITELPE